MTAAPVEVTTRYATTVVDLPAAWAFVMDKLDRLGSDPMIEITPYWSYSIHDTDDHSPPRQFSVVVSSMTEEAKP